MNETRTLKAMIPGCPEILQVCDLLNIPEHCESFTVYVEDGVVKVKMTMTALTEE